jgi:very-short-patch-repair endonuclease
MAATRPGLGSPLEVAFAMAWDMYRVSANRRGTCGADFRLEPQYEVLDYRVDFRIVCASHVSLAPQFPKFAIELDGHEFHEKTRDQVARRNERDRALLLAGWRVIRFSGSEFYRKSYECIEGAWTQADYALADLVHAEWEGGLVS